MPASGPFVHSFRVRYHECDAQGIVFNANWLTYFDVALTEWFREAFGSYDALVEAGCDVVLAETTVTFHGSARFDDELAVDARVERLGTTSMVVRFTARRDGEALVEGRTVYVFVDPATMGKREIPGDVRATLERYGNGAGVGERGRFARCATRNARRRTPAAPSARPSA